MLLEKPEIEALSNQAGGDIAGGSEDKGEWEGPRTTFVAQPAETDGVDGSDRNAQTKPGASESDGRFENPDPPWELAVLCFDL